MDMENILSGCRLKNEKHLEDTRINFISSICNSTTDVSKQIAVCNSELERVKLLKDHFKWKSLPEDSFAYSRKCQKIAGELMKRAEKFFKRSNVEKALRCLNISIMFATKELLGTAFAKRATLFSQIHEEDAAIRDIQLALENNCPENLLAKLIADSVKWRNERDLMKNVQHEEIHKEILENQCPYLHLKNPHQNILNAEEFLTIDYAEECGRRIITTENVKAGTLLISEEIYSSVLTNLLIWDTEHCHYCCRPILGGIPCPDCVFTSYCSEECRQKAFDAFHRYERKFLPFFHSNPTTCLIRDVLSLRTIFTVGPSQLYEMFRRGNSPLHSETAKKAGFNKEGIYDSSSYLPICNLISHVSNFRTTQILSNIFKCFVYAEFLDDETDFFSQLQYDNKNSEFSKEFFKQFISSLLLRHMESIPFNAISISKLKNRDTMWKDGSSNFEAIDTVSYGMGLYSLLCLCNHSCDPNIIPLRSPNSTRVSVIALRNLIPGEELCICYGPSYQKQCTVDRREFLQSKYNFECQCIACTHDWFDDSFENNNGRIELTDGDDVSRILSEAQQLILKGGFIPALNLLRPCLISLTGQYDNLEPTKFRSTKLCQQLYKLVLVWLFNSHSSCLPKNMSLLKSP